MKIGFISKNRVDLDLSSLPKCNPGIGGTEYLFLNVPYQLSQRPGMEVTLYSLTDAQMKNEGGLTLKYSRSPDEAYIDAVSNEYDLIITSESAIPKERLYGQTKLVLWLHLSRSIKEMKGYAKFFDAIIFVSKYELMRFYRLRDVRKKGCYISNLVPLFSERIPKESPFSHTLCYVGSVTPGKGIDSLTRAWPKIRKRIPDAKLFVIGSGNLYDPSAPLGPMGITDDGYEKTIMEPLKRNHLEDSVIFFGKKDTLAMGAILSDVSVGIVNLPSGLDETFCMSTFDFARYDIPVVCRQSGGIKDIINRRCSFSYSTRSERRMVNTICRAFMHPRLAQKKGQAFHDNLALKFGSETVLEKWHGQLGLIAGGLPRRLSMSLLIGSLAMACGDVAAFLWIKIKRLAVEVKRLCRN